MPIAVEFPKKIVHDQDPQRMRKHISLLLNEDIPIFSTESFLL
jgi:hypothetical protein